MFKIQSIENIRTNAGELDYSPISDTYLYQIIKNKSNKKNIEILSIINIENIISCNCFSGIFCLQAFIKLTFNEEAY